MNFEQNLFISYAHIDDAPLNAGEKGWITRFHTTLNAMLSMRLGREAKIWRDEKLQGQRRFFDEIVAHFRRSAAADVRRHAPLSHIRNGARAKPANSVRARSRPAA